MAVSLDFVVTCVTALALAGIGLLMPAFTEDYDAGLTPSAPGFLAAAVILLGSLASSVTVLRSRKDGARRAGLLPAVSRLGLITLTAIACVVYGAFTV
ncbi:hypothetical protein ACIF80_06650 [Streptomyces sp. NPDC085927]|uniref:hypothetical protein n=1 Tax=Streptomyces sp. NPDC085927 TaxID=3365738 RepID=UPI0037CEF4BF